MFGEQEWLDSLTTGDTVIVNGRHRSSLSKVERLTKTLIILENGERFRKKGGRKSGDHNPWGNTYIIQPTSDRLERMANSRFRNKLRIKVSELESTVRNLGDIDKGTRKEVNELVNKLFTVLGMEDKENSG